MPLVVLGEALNPRGHIFQPRHQHPSHPLTKPVLSEQHHVCTPVQGSTDHRGGKGGVHHVLGARILGDLGDRLDVGQGPQEREVEGDKSMMRPGKETIDLCQKNRK